MADLDVAARAGPDAPLVLPFRVTTPAPFLVFDFRGTLDHAILSAIEIFAAPPPAEAAPSAGGAGRLTSGAHIVALSPAAISSQRRAHTCGTAAQSNAGFLQQRSGDPSARLSPPPWPRPDIASAR